MVRCVVIAFALLLAAGSRSVRVINFVEWKERVMQSNDTLYVVNFWATWCKPCVAELPLFENAADKYATQPVKFVLVSLNHIRELKAANRLLLEKQISVESLLLDAGNPNLWIDSIAPEWGGSIPATVMYRNGRKVFFREGEFDEMGLDSIIKTKLN